MYDTTMLLTHLVFFFFFFNDTATTEIYTLSLHDALPISCRQALPRPHDRAAPCPSAARSPSGRVPRTRRSRDRKSTRLNSSHGYISYAVFCLKKKKKQYLLSATATEWEVSSQDRCIAPNE